MKLYKVTYTYETPADTVTQEKYVLSEKIDDVIKNYGESDNLTIQLLRLEVLVK